jgi:hypothetical protein
MIVQPGPLCAPADLLSALASLHFLVCDTMGFWTVFLGDSLGTGVGFLWASRRARERRRRPQGGARDWKSTTCFSPALSVRQHIDNPRSAPFLSRRTLDTHLTQYTTTGVCYFVSFAFFCDFSCPALAFGLSQDERTRIPLCFSRQSWKKDTTPQTGYHPWLGSGRA